MQFNNRLPVNLPNESEDVDSPLSSSHLPTVDAAARASFRPVPAHSVRPIH